VRITYACICGSDLWFYRGITQWEPGWRAGHEWMGIVETVGPEVRTIKPGDRVIAPFAFSDGTCEFCKKGLFTSCIHGDFWGGKDHEGVRPRRSGPSWPTAHWSSCRPRSRGTRPCSRRSCP
jgi:threonine dehydrogenase-like Zn-dependent dehydrogenase